MIIRLVSMSEIKLISKSTNRQLRAATRLEGVPVIKQINLQRPAGESRTRKWVKGKFSRRSNSTHVAVFCHFGKWLSVYRRAHNSDATATISKIHVCIFQTMNSCFSNFSYGQKKKPFLILSRFARERVKKLSTLEEIKIMEAETFSESKRGKGKKEKERGEEKARVVDAS